MNSTAVSVHEAIRTIRHALTLLSLLFAVPPLIIVPICAKKTSKRYAANMVLIVVSDFICIAEPREVRHTVSIISNCESGKVELSVRPSLISLDLQ